ncbi:MAG: DNA replication/repair protein RecF, partial [Acidimicrobiales bacterium]
RDFLDDLLEATSAEAGAARIELERVLRHRNALLRQARGRLGGAEGLSLDVWDERLALVGSRVARARARLIGELAPCCAAAFAAITQGAGVLELSYETSFGDDLLTAVRAAREEDLRRQVTTVGPQRDELWIRAGGLDARTRLSQGRQRCAALALRLGSHRYVAGVTGVVPVLLLDDAFSELDADTGRRLLEELPEGQALLTTAGPIPTAASPSAVIRLYDGAVL